MGNIGSVKMMFTLPKSSAIAGGVELWLDRVSRHACPHSAGVSVRLGGQLLLDAGPLLLLGYKIPQL